MSLKKLTSILLLLSLLPYCSFSQEVSQALSSAQRIRQIVQELNQISTERENYLNELENMNRENEIELRQRESELQQRILELNARERELNELKLQLELFGNLIDDQAAYIKNSQKKLTFWRVTSGILATSLATTIIIWSVSR